MEANVMKPTEHVLVRLSALEITAKLAKVCILFVIDICFSYVDIFDVSKMLTLVCNM